MVIGDRIKFTSPNFMRVYDILAISDTSVTIVSDVELVITMSRSMFDGFKPYNIKRKKRGH